MVRGRDTDRGTTVRHTTVHPDSGTLVPACYELTGRLLGIGSFGRVLEAIQTVDTQGQPINKLVALKYQFIEDDEERRESIIAEIQLQKLAAHKYCVSIVDTLYDAEFDDEVAETIQNCIVIVMECTCPLDVLEIIRNEGQMPENLVRTYFTQLIEGIAHCHGQNVCHRDLKPENLSFDFNTLALKILDFGEGKVLDESSITDTMDRGSAYYRAPELMSNGSEERKGYDAKVADVWSCGVILFVMMCGCPPIQEQNESDPGYKSLSEHDLAAFWQEFNSEPNIFFSSSARDLINKLLVPNPHKRITIDGIKAHPWYNETVLGPSLLKQEMTRVIQRAEANMIKKIDEVQTQAVDASGLLERDIVIGAAVVDFESDPEDGDSSDEEESEELTAELDRRRAEARIRQENFLEARREAQEAKEARRQTELQQPEDDGGLYGTDEDEEDMDVIERKFSTTPPSTNYSGASLLSFLMSEDTSLSAVHRSAQNACVTKNTTCSERGEFEWLVQNDIFKALVSIYSVPDMNTHMVSLSYLGGFRDRTNTSRTHFNQFRAHVLRKMKKHINTETCDQ